MNFALVLVLACNSQLVSASQSKRVTPSSLSSHAPAHSHFGATLGIDGSMAGELMNAVAGAVDQVTNKVVATWSDEKKHQSEQKSNLRPAPQILHSREAPVYAPGEAHACSILGGLFSANLSASCCFSVNALTQRSLVSHGLAKPCLAAWSCEKNGITPTVKFERNAARQMCKEQGCSDAVTSAMYKNWLTWRSAGKMAEVCNEGDTGFAYAPKVASAVSAYALRAKHKIHFTRSNRSNHTNTTEEKKSEDTSSSDEEKSEDASSSDDEKKKDDEWTLEKCQKAHCDPDAIKDGSSERDMFCQHADSEEGETEKGHPCFEHCCSQSSCFPGDAIVRTRSRGDVTLATLQRGEDVLAEAFPGGPLRFEPVLDFIHRRPEKGGGYVELVHEGGRLRVSPNHLVFVAAQNGRMDKTAGDVSVGDRLFVVDGAAASQSRVLEVRHQSQAAGMYAPLTYSGTIVVDGVVASNYASPGIGVQLSHGLAHFMLLPLRIYSSVGFQKLTTALCEVVSVGCGEEESEYHPYVSFLYQKLNLHRMLSSS